MPHGTRPFSNSVVDEMIEAIAVLEPRPMLPKASPALVFDIRSPETIAIFDSIPVFVDEVVESEMADISCDDEDTTQRRVDPLMVLAASVDALAARARGR